jgi:hypothetical protein
MLNSVNNTHILVGRRALQIFRAYFFYKISAQGGYGDGKEDRLYTQSKVQGRKEQKFENMYAIIVHPITSFCVTCNSKL